MSSFMDKDESNVCGGGGGMCLCVCACVCLCICFGDFLLVFLHIILCICECYIFLYPTKPNKDVSVLIYRMQLRVSHLCISFRSATCSVVPGSKAWTQQRAYCCLDVNTSTSLMASHYLEPRRSKTLTVCHMSKLLFVAL